MRKKSTYFALLTFLLVIASIELMSFFAFQFIASEKFQVQRKKLLSLSKEYSHFQNSIGLPYLLYGLSPQYKSHNEQGFRGAIVPFEKVSSKKRILFLGGSTTYGWKVPHGERTYPDWVKTILKEEHGIDIEVINGGLPSGTSAELLTHYLFKYKYFKPDIVVINTGGNDAVTMSLKYYHPDYSHQRRQLQNPHQLTSYGRVLLRSYTLSFIILPMLEDLEKMGQLPVSDLDPQSPPVISWYPYMNAKDFRKTMFPVIPKERNAFYQNITTLVEQIKNDKTKVLLFDFREAPENSYHQGWLEGFEVNRKTLNEIALSNEITHIPFPKTIIDKSNWMDNCHLNSLGSKQKASFLVNYLSKIISEIE